MRSHLSFSLLFLLFLPFVPPPSFPTLPDESQLSTFDVFISHGRDPALRAEPGSRVRARPLVCQSVFLTSSSRSVVTSVLTAALEKRGSPLSCSPLVFLFRLYDTPTLGGEVGGGGAALPSLALFQFSSHPTTTHLILSILMTLAHAGKNHFTFRHFISYTAAKCSGNDKIHQMH